MSRTPVIVAALAAVALAAAAVVATTPAAAREGAVPAAAGVTQDAVPAGDEAALAGDTEGVPAVEPQEEGAVNGLGCIAGPTVDHDPYDEDGLSLVPSAPVPDDPDGTEG